MNQEKKYIEIDKSLFEMQERFQYISEGKDPLDHLQNIEEVCEAGCRWVQLRLKNVDMATYLNIAIKCRNICDQYGAIMIVNESISIAKASLADGVHLGLNDMCLIKARKTLGENHIIGRTANTVDDCIQHIKDKVDYIGLRPFQNTTTKENLNSVLRLEEYKALTSNSKIKNSEIPIIAVGEIQLKDIKDVLRIGYNGIAVSKMLTNCSNMKEKIEEIKRIMTKNVID